MMMINYWSTAPIVIHANKGVLDPTENRVQENEKNKNESSLENDDDQLLDMYIIFVILTI